MIIVKCILITSLMAGAGSVKCILITSLMAGAGSDCFFSSLMEF